MLLYDDTRKLKTLNDLKVKIMEELQVNPALHDIHITFRSPYEVLNQCINYRYMAITEDKHVKFMFSKMQKRENVADLSCTSVCSRVQKSA